MACTATQRGHSFLLEVEVHTLLYLSRWDFRKDVLLINITGLLYSDKPAERNLVVAKDMRFLFTAYPSYAAILVHQWNSPVV